jgi:SAM-dependent methyltransferase
MATSPRQFQLKELLRIVHTSVPADERARFYKLLLDTGQIFDSQLAELDAEVARTEGPRIIQKLEREGVLAFVNSVFGGSDQYRARALVTLMPEEFYSIGLAARICIGLKANQGEILVGPRRPINRRAIETQPLKNLAQFVQDQIRELAIECWFRVYLPVFARNFDEGMSFLKQDLAAAPNDFEERVLSGVLNLVEQLAAMRFPGVVESLHGFVFPALHVRWWLHQTRNQQRLLNMADTGAYKTSHGVLATHEVGCEHTLVLTPAHARENWAREIPLYFVDPVDVRVVTSRRQLDGLAPGRFTIVGYPLLNPDTAQQLVAMGFDGLIQDECHLGKNVFEKDSEGNGIKRAQGCLTLIQQLQLKRYVALSATPWENRPQELAAIAVALKPELFPDATRFVASGVHNSPRLVRELFATQIVEIELDEIRDLPPVTPSVRQDLFAAVPLTMNAAQRKIYEYVLNDPRVLPSHEKVLRLLLAAVHPPRLLDYGPWPEWMRQQLCNWSCSSKLVWIMERISERIATDKIVVACGLYAEGITRLSEDKNQDITMVAQLLRDWFGDQAVVVIDGEVSLRRGRRGASPREEAIQRWRTDPTARILLVYMDATREGINLSVGDLPGVERVTLMTLSLGWVPPQQFIGRFNRHGQATPIERMVPVLTETIDDALLHLNREKRRLFRLFKSAPLTDDELADLATHGDAGLERLAYRPDESLRSIITRMRKQGEEANLAILEEKFGATTYAQKYVQAFAELWEKTLANNIANFMRPILTEYLSLGVLTADECLDAGCGLLRLARTINAPCYSVDFNPEMITAAREIAPALAVNASVARLSQLPADWTGKFKLVVASLVMDMTTLEVRSGTEPDRLRILRELVRVCHPNGKIWLTWTEQEHDEKTFAAWCNALRAEGYTVALESGLVRATDKPEHHCAFWSLVFTPHGKRPRFADSQALRHLYETVRVVRKSGRRNGKISTQIDRGEQHHEFEVERVVYGLLPNNEAVVKSVLESEQRHLARQMAAGESGVRVVAQRVADRLRQIGDNWRVLMRAIKRGFRLE